VVKIFDQALESLLLTQTHSKKIAIVVYVEIIIISRINAPTAGEQAFLMDYT
jgi:hypothetical protein